VRAAAATLGRLPRAVVVLPRALALGPHGRRRLVALAIVVAALGALYMFWLRDSSLVRVDRVSISGVSPSPDGARVRSKLAAAGTHMTTLHVDAEALRHAVADEPTVHSLSVQANFPHGLKIEIVENRPVALLVSPGRAVAVAPDGTVLAGSKLPSGLPTVRVGALPPGVRLPDGGTRDRVAVAGAAPSRLLARVDSISFQSGRGAVAQLQDGPVLIFGRPVELARKWAAAVAVLAQHSSAGATYIDVRMPERPVAGGLGLQQDPQAQAQVGGAVPAEVPAPGSTSVTGGTQTPQQSQSQTPVAPSSTAPTAPSATAATAPSQAQP
jgi:cell division protein FtsQ